MTFSSLSYHWMHPIRPPNPVQRTPPARRGSKLAGVWACYPYPSTPSRVSTGRAGGLSLSLSLKQVPRRRGGGGGDHGWLLRPGLGGRVPAHGS
jgi:hypothetical protein